MILYLFLLVVVSAGAGAPGVPSWGLGPFTRAAENPIIVPTNATTFVDPLTGKPSAWMSLHTFNPALALFGGSLQLLFRAEDSTGDQVLGSHTSRVGLASQTSPQNPFGYAVRPHPVLYPTLNDSQSGNEVPGGCEDPRVVEHNGTFYMYYTQWNRKLPRLAVATSADLVTWEKHGPVFGWNDTGSKSGSVVTRLDASGRLVAAAVGNNGTSFVMYWGDSGIRIAHSADLIRWVPGPMVLPARPGLFDSQLAEAGPPAVHFPGRGIVLLYNGMNKDGGAGMDPAVPPGQYTAGQALMSEADPAAVLDRTTTPFFRPEMPYERSGQYANGTTFIQGLVHREGVWYLSYGAADSVVCMAAFGGAPGTPTPTPNPSPVPSPSATATASSTLAPQQNRPKSKKMVYIVSGGAVAAVGLGAALALALARARQRRSEGEEAYAKF
jgi:predicted GH43/DUF377 family glycosyl hydrolase